VQPAQASRRADSQRSSPAAIPPTMRTSSRRHDTRNRQRMKMNRLRKGGAGER
jgi:hypothetical protein